MTDRTCIECVHFSIDLGERAWSDVTPGYSGSVECYKNQFKALKEGMSVGAFREAIATAKTCELFKDYKEEPV